MSIQLPCDAMGMTARECSDQACSPGAFKVKNGTGITGGQEKAYCPYCRRDEQPDEFVTKEQERYIRDIVTDQAAEGIERMVRDTFGLGISGRKRIDAGMLSLEMSMKPSHRSPVRRPWEEQLRRDVTCPHCTLEHAVYGLATWCPDCGADILNVHVEAEYQVIRTMLNDVERRNRVTGRACCSTGHREQSGGRRVSIRGGDEGLDPAKAISRWSDGRGR